MWKLASIVFLLDAIAIGLGAFGHGASVRHLRAAIDHFRIDADSPSDSREYTARKSNRRAR